MQKLPQRAQFEHFGGLASDMGKSGLREFVSGLWFAGRGYGQKLSQRAQFEYFGGLAADMSKSWLREFSLTVLVGWPRILAKVTSETSV